MKLIGTKKGWDNLKRKTKRKPNKWSSYAERNRLLSDMGFDSYEEYLGSELWKSIRTAKAEAQPTCLLCPSPTAEIHHLSYDLTTMTGGNSHRLVGLCASCHHHLEFDGPSKRTLLEANQILFFLAPNTPQGKLWIDAYDATDHKARKAEREAAKATTTTKKRKKGRRQKVDKSPKPESCPLWMQVADSHQKAIANRQEGAILEFGKKRKGKRR